MNVYTSNGYTSRNQYLMSLSEEYGVDFDTIYAIADLLGESEDFDGLVSQLQDM